MFAVKDDMLEEFTSANTEAIKSILLKQLAAADLDKNALKGLATEGSSLMTGKRNGLAAKLRRECKILLNVRCICHRMPLACGDADDEI